MNQPENWGGVSSEEVVQGGLKANSDRMLGKQLAILQNRAPANLVSELPPDPSRPLAAQPSGEAAWQFVKDLLTRHRGEVREIFGCWKAVGQPFPDIKNNPELFHAQYCHHEEEARSMIPWQGTGERSQSAMAGKGKPASGGKNKGKGEGTSKNPASGGDKEAAEPSDNTVVMREAFDPNVHWRREAKVCGLADLFQEFGEQWTGKEMFEYYESLHIFAHKRERGKSAPERRAAAHERFRNIGYYGFGSWQ